MNASHTLIQLLCYSGDWKVPSCLWKVINVYVNDKKKDSWKLYNKFGLHFIESQYVKKNIFATEIPVNISTPSSRDFLS